MAISPPSDIVLGVARAVDPSAYQAAVDRLAGMGAASAPLGATGTAEASQTDWKALVLKLAAEEAGQSRPAVAPPSAAPLQVASTPPTQMTSSKKDPYKQFESFVLQSFIESMLPQDADSVFGGGIAGQYWKSMMAEKLAEQLAESGSIGIARQLAAQNSPPASPTPETPTKQS